MKTVRFECEDRYEAEKLAGLVSVQKDDTVYIAGISAVVGTEIVIKLKDNSSHAVIMKDEDNVGRLKSLLQDVARGKTSIQASDFDGSVAEITVGD
jgi:hypothetical protein